MMQQPELDNQYDLQLQNPIQVHEDVPLEFQIDEGLNASGNEQIMQLSFYDPLPEDYTLPVVHQPDFQEVIQQPTGHVNQLAGQREHRHSVSGCLQQNLTISVPEPDQNVPHVIATYVSTQIEGISPSTGANNRTVEILQHYEVVLQAVQVVLPTFPPEENVISRNDYVEVLRKLRLTLVHPDVHTLCEVKDGHQYALIVKHLSSVLKPFNDKYHYSTNNPLNPLQHEENLKSLAIEIWQGSDCEESVISIQKHTAPYTEYLDALAKLLTEGRG